MLPHIKQTLRVLFEIIFPTRTDARIVAKLSSCEMHSLCFPRTEQIVVCLTAFSYERVRACIHEVKFHDNQKAAELLGSVLHSYMSELASAIIVIPIPLSDKRKCERGYNQVERIAKIGLRGTHHTLETDILYRAVDTPPQTKMSREERLQNVKDAFAIHETDYSRKKIVGKHIILLDDVATTGATLKAAKVALEKLKPESVTCIAIAH